jgi:enterochelin esterase family protein
MAQSEKTEKQDSLQSKFLTKGTSPEQLREKLIVGSDEWWLEIEALSTPIVTTRAVSTRAVTSKVVESKRDTDTINHTVNHDSLVTLEFYWRDPEGNEATSSTAKVYIDIPNITNHHTFSPDALERIDGTDVWYWKTSVEPDWRGSYSFIPVKSNQLPPEETTDDQINRNNLRQWWRSLQAHAIADPLNRRAPILTPWSTRYSSIHLNDAPYQHGWHQSDTQKVNHYPDSELKVLTWTSETLNNNRSVWMFTPQANVFTAGHQPPRPLVIMLDGEFWAKVMPIFNTLKMEVTQQRLSAATFLLIDSINPQVRATELACNPNFWLAVQSELLPQVAEHSLYPLDMDNIIVAGQSFGGLSATYAGINWPERFNRIITQSGSYWWPHLELMKNPFSDKLEGFMLEQVKQQEPKQLIKIYQEVGSKEQSLLPLNKQLHKQLICAGHDANFYQYNGGHDRLCWRGGLIHGLHQFIKHDLQKNMKKSHTNHTVSKEKVINDGKRLHQPV